MEVPPTSSASINEAVNSNIRQTEQLGWSSVPNEGWDEKGTGRNILKAWAPEITYHYFTFDTELPFPSQLPPRDGTASPPEAPDLTEYISPFLWSHSRKAVVLWLSCITTMVTAYCAGSYSSAAAQLSEYWDVGEIAILVGITTFTTGFAIAPMV